MKKVLSVVLALVMMFAVCVPAFAAELKGNKENGWQAAGDVIIKTQTVDEEGNPIDPEDFANFTVNIPADTTIDWGTTDPVDVGYTVESHLLRNQQLKVVVAGTGSMKTDPANGKVYEIAYTLDGTTEYLANTQVVYPAVAVALNVVIDADTWNKAVVETYTDTLTYTASVVPFVEA